MVGSPTLRLARGGSNRERFASGTTGYASIPATVGPFNPRLYQTLRTETIEEFGEWKIEQAS
jgi:hypothetical protein